MDIQFFNTHIEPGAHKVLSEVLSSGFLSEGRLVREFEQKLSTDYGINNVIAVNSGTSALHLALILAGVGEGDEVIMPAQTFVATGLVALHQKATPVFADIDYRTGNLSLEAVRKKITPKTKAIMPVHWGGYPCDMDELLALAEEHQLVVIEDAAHAFGAVYKKKPIGSISHFTCFSFQAIKHITTGDGGAIACRLPADAEAALRLRWFGIDRHRAAPSPLGERQYNIDQAGYKYHLNDYAAALGLANLNGFEARMRRRREMARKYFNELKSVDGITLLNYSDDRSSAYWLFPMHVERRDDLINALKSRKVPSSVVHQRIDRNSIFGGLKKDLPEQERFDRTQLHIPIHDALDDEKLAYIIESIQKGW